MRRLMIVLIVVVFGLLVCSVGLRISRSGVRPSYDRVKMGMDLQQVQAVLEGEGYCVGVFEDSDATWYRWDYPKGTICVLFKNGKAEQKRCDDEVSRLFGEKPLAPVK